jgi:ParB family transcriptional regulator, chromosome partitioning protein
VEPPPTALAHGDRLAEAVQLDMASAGWAPTVGTYLGRVTKARILQAVREGRGQTVAERLESLKKGEMAEQAQALLAGSGWLPEPLRTSGLIAIGLTEPSGAVTEHNANMDQAEAVPSAEEWPDAAP